MSAIEGWAGEGFWDWVAIKGLDITAATGGVFPEDFWWWFRSTRVIDTLAADGSSLDYTITEFPAFSFVLGDLHAHVQAIPFLLLAICVALNACLSPDRLGWSWLARHPAQAAALALSGGALAFINFWDFPTFLAITVGALLLKGWCDYPGLPLQADQCRPRGIRTAVVPVAGDVRALLSRRIQRPDLGNTAIAGRGYKAVPPLHCPGVVHPDLAGVLWPKGCCGCGGRKPPTRRQRQSP